jgi:membrane protease YdiL (CAAX protease family)
MKAEADNHLKNIKNFKLHEYPWLSLLAFIIITLFSITLTGTVIFEWVGLSRSSFSGQLVQESSFKILSSFLLAPLILRLPKGRRTYKQFLEDIGLTRVQPFVRLVLLALTCYIILALSQASASFLYRLFEGRPITWIFVQRIFDLSEDLNPNSPSLLFSIAGALEEVAFRGIILTVFQNKYSDNQSILFSSIGFGLMHLLNLTSGHQLVWVLGQVVWATIIGLFYGYVFVRTRSLLPSMIVHYFSNVFIYSLSEYLRMNASIEVQVFYGVTLLFGVVPVSLMVLWTRYFASRWLAQNEGRNESQLEQLGI